MENNGSSFAGGESATFAAEAVEQAEQNIDQSMEAQALAGEEVETEELEAKNNEAETEEVEAKEDPLSRKFAALSRKDKALREREKQLNAKMAELEAKMASLEPKEEKAPEVNIDDLLRKNPLEALKAKGYDLNALAEIALNDGKLPIELQMQLMREELENSYKSDLEMLKREMAEKSKSEEEARYDQAVENFKNEIEDTVSQDVEKYELINSTGSLELVYDTIVEHHEATKDESGNGEILDIHEAAELVEQYLLEEAQKVFKANKIKNLLNQNQSKPAKESSELKQESVTLTNSSSSKMPQTQGNQLMSDDESLREAAKLIKWIED